MGQHTLVLATAITLAVLTLVLLILVLVLQNTVVAPLSGLSKKIESIQTTGKLDTRLALNHDDEIGVLAKSFDSLLVLLGERAERLEHMATIDELTELLNRRAIMDFLHMEVERAIRYENGLAVLLLDVDHFKCINDTEGHATSDRVLRNVARVLKSTIRETDRLGRYDGEEFLVVTPCQTEEGALAAAERLRLAVEKAEGLGSLLPVTVSIGVALWAGYTREGLLYIADRNLYRAKREGRNCVVMRTVALNELPKTSLAALRMISHPPRKID